MVHRILATTIWGPAASALRGHPGAVVPLPPLAAAVPSRFVGTIHNQTKPQSNTKRTQQDSVYVIQLVSLLAELEKFTQGAKQRVVELQQFQRQKKKAQKLSGFTLAGVAGMTLFEARRLAAVA